MFDSAVVARDVAACSTNQNISHILATGVSVPIVAFQSIRMISTNLVECLGPQDLLLLGMQLEPLHKHAKVEPAER